MWLHYRRFTKPPGTNLEDPPRDWRLRAFTSLLDPMNRDDGITVLKFLSLTCTALFAGGAVFINIAEHPARKALTPSQALIEWKESYERASFWQASNAVVGFLAGLGTTYLTGENVWATSGSILGAVVPYTLLVMMPTNKMLKNGLKKLADAQVGKRRKHGSLVDATDPLEHHLSHHGIPAHPSPVTPPRMPVGLSSIPETSVLMSPEAEWDGVGEEAPMWRLCFGTFAISGSTLGQIKTLLRSWGALHSVRSGLGMLSLGLLTAHAASARSLRKGL